MPDGFSFQEALTPAPAPQGFSFEEALEPNAAAHRAAGRGLPPALPDSGATATQGGAATSEPSPGIWQQASRFDDYGRPIDPDARPAPATSVIGASAAGLGSSLVSGAGEMVAAVPRVAAGVARLPAAAEANSHDLARQQMAVMDRVDAGEHVPAVQDPMGYQDMTAPQRKALRTQYEGALSSWKGVGETGVPAAGIAVAQPLERAAGAISGGAEWAGQQMFPVAPEMEKNIAVRTARMVGGTAPMLVSAVIGGAPAVAATAFTLAYESTFRQMEREGADAAQAHGAAFINGLANAGLMQLPAAQWLGGLTPELRQPVLNAAIGLATHSGTMVTVSQAQQLARNIATGHPLNEGLGENIPEQALTGALLPLVTGAVAGGPRVLRSVAGAPPRAGVPPIEGEILPPPPAPPPPPPPHEGPTIEGEVVPPEPPPVAPVGAHQAPQPSATPTLDAMAAEAGARQTPVQPTTPEPATDIHAQIEALRDPNNPKDAVFVTAANVPDLPRARLRPDVMEIHRPEGALLTTDPQKALAFARAPTLTDAMMANLLGLPETKTEAVASGAPVVVQGTDGQGRVVAETLASPAKVPEAAQTVAAQAPNVSVVSPDEAQENRGEKVAEQPPAPARGPTPFIPVPKDLRKPVDAIRYLASRGGIRPDADLLAMDADKINVPFVGKLLKPGGMPLNAAREQLHELGYPLEDPTDDRSIYGIISEHQSGRPTYAGQDQAGALELENIAAANVEIRRLADYHGIDPQGLTYDQFYDEVAKRSKPADLERIDGGWTQPFVAALDAARNDVPGYSVSETRSLEDLEREYAAENAAGASGAGIEDGAGHPPVVPDAGAGEGGAGPDRRGAGGEGRAGEGEGEQGLAQPRRLPTPPRAGPDLFNAPAPEPRAAPVQEPLIRTDPRQTTIPGTEASAVQAQAARDAQGRGALLPSKPQAKADEGLFAHEQTPQESLLPTRTSPWPIATDLLQHAPTFGHEVAADWVFHQGRATGHEHIAVIDNATGRVIHAGTDNRSDFITFDPRQIADLPPNALTIHHNHPSGSSLSVQDLQVMTADQIGHVVAVGHDGQTYVASSGPWMKRVVRQNGLARAQREITIRQAAARSKAMAIVRPLWTSGRLDTDTANATVSDLTNRYLNANGTIAYVSSYQLPEIVRDQFTRSVLASPAHADRSARAVQSAEAIASLPRPVEGQARGQGAGAGAATAADAGGAGDAGKGLAEETDPLSGEEPKPFGEGGDHLYSFPGMLFDPATYRRLAGPIAAPAKGVAHWAHEAAKSIADGLAPMRAGTTRSQAFAADFANALRQVQYRFGEIDREIERTFTPKQRDQMGRALDAQSVFEQQARDMAPTDAATARAEFDRNGAGLAGLNPAQRRTVEALNILSEDAWRQMKARGMVAPTAEGLPYYFPRQMVRWSDAEGFSRASGEGGGANRGLDQRGDNLTTAGPMSREHLTPEETEAAAKAKLGRDVQLLHDIRSLPQRLAFAHRAIAGVDLMNKIEQVGRDVGVNLVVRGDIPGLLQPADYFTMSDHPSFRRWTGSGWQAVHVAREFEGPLRAVLTQRSPTWYRAAQQVKGGVMQAIMWSPFIHLGVEVGRAAPLIIQHPALTMRSLVAAHNLRHDLGYMDMATRDGLAPLGVGWHSDPVSIADAANVESRTGFLRALGNVRDAIANGAKAIGGQTLHDIVQHPQTTLLWDQVFNLQIGLYDSMRTLFMRRGYAPDVAGTMAAHIANRYAGALPPEHLSRAANMAANLLLFSRSFTLGNLGVMKDMFTGAPPHIRARIEQIAGPEVAKTAQGAMRRKAFSAVTMDIGLFLIGGAVVQLGLQALRNSPQQGLPAAAQQAYEQWLEDSARAVTNAKQNPLEVFGVLPQYWNEPGKQNRIYTGADSSGRGIYARLPPGKIGEEFLGWPKNPAAMLLNKSSPLIRPLLELVLNTDSLGRKVYNPDPQTFGDYARIAGALITHIGGDLGPTSAIQGIKELFQHGIAPDKTDEPLVSAAKILGPMTGLALISQGFPGGPAAGELHAESERERYAQEQAMPAIRQKILAGDRAGAEKDMIGLHMGKGQIKFYMNQTLHPGPSPGALGRLPTMPPRVQERVQRQLQPP
jgi:hypothetical protein